jgi:hypothetical protein
MIHWKKLPKLTSIGTYEINVPLDDFNGTLDKYINQYHLDLNPDFQRGRVWKQSQQIKYIEFLLMGGVTNNVIYFNHPGWMNSFNGDFVIVDGLQRITSILDFLDNKFKVFDEYSSYIDLRGHYNIKFNINNLKTRKEVLKWYLEINSNGTPHTEDEIEKVKNLLEEEE